jgi:hypothetical protein
MANSIFGHLVMRFSSSPENLATEALCFILNGSPAARASFSHLLANLQIILPENLVFETQGHSSLDKTIPDLVARDTRGREILLGEAKFWAGLTDKQPVTYLRRLIESEGKLLIIFAPSMRFPTLWPELQYRCNHSGVPMEVLPTTNPEIHMAKSEPDQVLVLMSWRMLLDTLHHTLLSQGELDMAGNVVQLQGLCEQMDTTAFLPLQSEELTSLVSRRYLQYCDLVDEVTEKLVAERFASKRGYRATGTRISYIRYIHIRGHASSLEFNSSLWSKYRATPIWLGIQSNDWKFDAEAKSRLVSLETERPPRLFVEGKILYVPILLETGVEKSKLVELMILQIKDVFALLTDNITR